jgi:hypothetical protein
MVAALYRPSDIESQRRLEANTDRTFDIRSVAVKGRACFHAVMSRYLQSAFKFSGWPFQCPKLLSDYRPEKARQTYAGNSNQEERPKVERTEQQVLAESEAGVWRCAHGGHPNRSQVYAV